MVPFPIPGFISAVYTPCKDLFLYLRGKSEDIENLKERLRDLRLNLASVISRKEVIDRSLGTSVTQKKSKEYEVMEKEFEDIRKHYAKFISKYARLGKLGIATTKLDDSFTALEMEKFEEIKSTILTFSFFTLAKLSRDIEKLNKRVLRVLESLDPKYTMQKIEEPYQEKLFHDTDLPVFNEYVAAVFRHLSRKKNRVGITGPSGVGKTTVLRKLYNQLLDKKYDNIIWIQEKGTAEMLQTEIMLQLQIHDEKTGSVLMNANNISAFLREKKYILLMDHVSEKIDLNDLGIREAHEHGNVVIGSSNRKAISSMIKEEVEIKTLDNRNARLLFESICGEVNDRLEGTASRIILCCGGLPREIKSVAVHLKAHPDEGSWNNMKKTLQSHTDSTDMIGLAGFDLFYKEKYQELRNMSYQKCFLYAALFPHEDIIHRDYLIECWMAECFLENDNIAQELRNSRDLGQGVLDSLTGVFLLEWCSDRKRVKMPSICRRVALQQAYPGEEECSAWVPVDYQKPNDETWKTVTRMSLIDCKTELPESPECCNIYTLLLRSKPELENIPDSFFSQMHELLVLDVYGTEIKQLPSSINMLVNLKCLYLNSCKHLEMLPPEATHLVKLQCLDISRTLIPSLPEEISKMVELRCLRASFSPEAASAVTIIPLHIIENLKKLEELSIDTGLYTPPGEMAQELAKELASLEYLTTLRFNFPNFSSFNTFVTQSRSLNNKETSWESSTFSSFRISVGCCHETKNPFELDVLLHERRLRISVNAESSSACKELSRQASVFELIGNQSVETLSEFDLHSVEICVVGNCSSLKNIEDVYTIAENEDNIVEESRRGVFKDLEKLHLYDLQLLECLWKRTSIPQGLHRLTVITLRGCPNLTRILDPELSRALPSLKHLKVDNCCRISQIVEVPNDSNDSELDDILNSVSSVELMNLPCLQSVCSSNTLSWNSLEHMVIGGCSTLSNLSLTQTNAQRLTSITCERSWWNQLQLADGVKQRLLPFCRFEEESSEPGERPDQETSNGIIPAPAVADASASGEERAELISSSLRYSDDHHQALITNDGENGHKNRTSFWWKAKCLGG